ncbi:MAG: ATP-dependent helicase, partial [Anaerolineae bacterium]
DTVDAYTHRIGRTGRAKETGEAFTFVLPEEAGMVRDIERVLGKRIERRRLQDFDYGDFVPENHLQSNGTNRPRNNRSPRRQNGSGSRSGSKNGNNARRRRTSRGKPYARQGNGR